MADRSSGRVLILCRLFIGVLALATACRKEPPPPAQPPQSASNAAPAPAPPTPPAPAIRYRPLAIEGATWLAERTTEWGNEKTLAFLKINRVDLKHVRQGETLLMPEPMNDALSFSPFVREIEAARSVPKLLLVSRRVQGFAAYESGKLVQWGPTSTGKRKTPTPAGLFFTNWKSRERKSTVNDEWLLRWVFNFDSLGGVSFHQYELPGYPASHSCVRLLEEDARWIYHWAEQWIISKQDGSILAYGTPVIIFGEYAFGKQPPWKRLLEDAGATTITPHEIEEALRPHLALIQERVQARASLLAAANREH